MLRRIVIGRHERGFLFHRRDYLRLLGPGAHWVWGFGRSVVRCSTQELELARADLDVLLADPAVRAELVVADLADGERGLLLVDGRVRALLGPGRRAFWRDLHEVRLEVFSVEKLQLIHHLLPAILAVDAGKLLLTVEVPKGHRGLLYVDQALHKELEPGRYAFWQGAAKVAVDVVDLREQALEVQGQEILTADKVSLRLNVTAAFRIHEPKAALEQSRDCAGALYRELQLALRAAVGARTLDALLSTKEEVSLELRQAVLPRAQELGLALGAVGVKDVILPGEMKTLLNQVIEAEKRAQANLVQRREETAATRSLLNTAKLIESSPTLLRLKELEVAERMAGSIGSIQLVGGGLEGLLKELLPRTKGAAAGEPGV